MRTLHIKQIS